ncbi:MAG: DUF6807 family protein, partial [Actinomycetota bacterium]
PPPRLGWIEHVDFTELIDDLPRFGFVEKLRWSDDRGETVIEETRSVLAHFRDQTHCILDLDSTYAAAKDLSFGTTKESVLPGIRMAEALTCVCGGHLRSSDGGRGETQIFGKPAEWFDYWGERKAVYGLGDVVEGVAVFDHPSNPNHPNPVFVRAYGPNSPFQGHHFTGETTLSAAEAWRYRHRLVVHYGDTEEADIAGKYRAWIQEGS